MKFLLLLLLLIPLSTFAQQDQAIKRIDSVRYAVDTRIWELERRVDSITEVLKHCLQMSYSPALTPGYTTPIYYYGGDTGVIGKHIEPDSTIYPDPEAKPSGYDQMFDGAWSRLILGDTLTVFQGYPSKQGALYDVPGWANGVGKAIYLDGAIYYIHRRKDKTYYITRQPVHQ